MNSLYCLLPLNGFWGDTIKIFPIETGADNQTYAIVVDEYKMQAFTIPKEPFLKIDLD